jgi:hypothetical protein
VQRIPWDRDRLSFWHSVVYFDVVAGREDKEFDVHDVQAALTGRGVRQTISDGIPEYLRRLEHLGLIAKIQDEATPLPRYTPTRIGAWS